MTSSTDEPTGGDVATILACYEAWERGDIDSAVAPMHPGIEWIEPDEFPDGGRRRGRAAVASYLRNSLATWSELHSERTAHIHRGDVVVIHRVHGRLVDGTPQDAVVADVFTLRDGQVVRMQAYSDPDAPFDR
jgi:ketosteroid isomerase-like protein